MSHKNIVKELVGGSLNAYHQKAKQAVDRIKNQNKQQNHMINVLTNELDNDYLDKTEEDSVISLDHSKEGMVYIDGLEGNTLVNYCTDGDKELTLNGDIDVEGTFVSTTEGVDGGKVDVCCEGNTLVNLVQTKHGDLFGTSGSGINFDKTYSSNGCLYTTKAGTDHYITIRTASHQLLKPNQKYTICFNINKNTIPNYNGVSVRTVYDSFFGEYTDTIFYDMSFDLSPGMKKIVITTGSDVSTYAGLGMGFRPVKNVDAGLQFGIDSVILLEGDYTDKPIPPYFEGMKSVGQDDVNGHKIEVLSNNNGSLNSVSTHNFNIDGERLNHELAIPIRSGELFKVSYTNSSTNNNALGICVITSTNKTYYSAFGGTGTHCNIYRNTHGEDINTIQTYRDTSYEGLIIDNLSINKVVSKQNIEPINYKEFKLNKKEISLQEPLRGLLNGVKDRFVKIGGKWYVERNFSKTTIVGKNVSFNNESYKTNGYNCILTRKIDNFNLPNDINLISDKLPTKAYSSGLWDESKEEEGISFVSDVWGFCIKLSNSKTGVLETDTTEEVKTKFATYLDINPIDIIYRTITPTYEPITDPVLITYLDTTHISNNSLIPCNMKIKNSGYNTIIKPNTLYTVALDTDKAGAIGLKLGGAKVTTSNNIATVTTPATLTDDSLRVSGKGVKGSKVRLLEGDKTNWIPSMFNGVLSCFEDKKNVDNLYEVEILSNNKNLICIAKETFKYKATSQIISSNSVKINQDGGKGYVLFDWFSLDRSKTYKINFNSNTNERNIYAHLFDGDGEVVHSLMDGNTFTPKRNKVKLGLYALDTEGTVYSDILLSEYDVSYMDNKSNKIQFSLQEPLRKWDRFVLVDGKPMIERGSVQLFFDGSEDENWYKNYEEINKTNVFCIENAEVKYSSMFYSYPYPYKVNYNNDNLGCWIGGSPLIHVRVHNDMLEGVTSVGFKKWLSINPITIIVPIKEPTYEPIPIELQKIILEGYENGTLFIDTIIPPTVNVRYAGQTPLNTKLKANSLGVKSNTDEINENLIPYVMDMDYRLLLLSSEKPSTKQAQALANERLFPLLKKEIREKRYSREEYLTRIIKYYKANRITDAEYNELEELLNEY